LREAAILIVSVVVTIVPPASKVPFTTATVTVAWKEPPPIRFPVMSTLTDWRPLGRLANRVRSPSLEKQI